MFVLIIALFLQFPGDYPTHDIIDQSIYPVVVKPMEYQRIVRMTFEDPHKDLGMVVKGEKRELNFNFINDGNEAIKIELVSACECTTLDWPRKAVAPGEKGTIHALFDSSEKEASETIEIDIYLENTDPETNRPIMKIISFKFDME